MVGAIQGLWAKLVLGNVQVSQCPDLGLDPEVSVVEAGTHRMLPGGICPW